jgi:hypothetical protein
VGAKSLPIIQSYGTSSERITREVRQLVLDGNGVNDFVELEFVGSEIVIGPSKAFVNGVKPLGETTRILGKESGGIAE